MMIVCGTENSSCLAFSPSLVYLNLSFISIASWFPHTLFPVGLWYYTCLTCFGAFSFLSFASFSSLISHNASLSSHSHKSRFPFYSQNSWWSYAPSVSPGTRHSWWSPFTDLPFWTLSTLGSLRSRHAWHSRQDIWSWNARKTMTEYSTNFWK